MATISVVIPVYKAENCLHELYYRLKTSIEAITHNFEIIMIEDCGGDCSWDIITELAQIDKRIKGIQFSRNFGQHYGITAGLDFCDGDWVIVMDCDLQDRPEEIPILYKKALEGYDVVLARRGKRKDTLAKRLSSWLFYKIFNYLTEMNYDKQVGNFRIMSRKVVENYRNMHEKLRFFGGLVDWLGFSTTSIDVQHEERFAGKTTYNFRKMFKLATEIIVAYSDKPLRLSIKGGFLISLFSFLYGIYILYRALFYKISVTGWSSIMVSMYFIGGIIILNLGIIGLYLGKNYDENKRRPLYIINNIVGNFNQLVEDKKNI